MYGALVVTMAVAIGTYARASSDAGKINVRADLRGAHEVPPISSPAEGLFTATVDIAAERIDFELTYPALEGGAATVAHIHFGQPRVSGGVIAFLCGGGGQSACPAEGTITGTILPANVVGPTGPDGQGGQGIPPGSFGELVAAIKGGLAYANVHNALFPGGEIRGQLTPTSGRE
jgi:hypothetical protein